MSNKLLKRRLVY